MADDANTASQRSGRGKLKLMPRETAPANVCSRKIPAEARLCVNARETKAARSWFARRLAERAVEILKSQERQDG